MGIEMQGKHLCFQKDDTSASVVVPVSNITKCREYTQRGGQDSSSVEKVELCFSLADSNSEQRILFYDGSDRFYISNELILAQEWQRRVESLIEGA